MSGAPPLPAAPDVTLLFGPLLIGVLLNTMLYGVMIVQAFLYHSRYKTDRPWFRYLVLYLVLAETVNWVCDVGIIYEPLITRYATPEALLTSPLLLRSDAVLTVLISTPIQLFIAWRVHIVTRSYVLPSIISLLALVSLGGGISVTTVVSLHPDYASFANFRAEVIIWLVSSTACDIFLTSSLVYSLVRPSAVKYICRNSALIAVRSKWTRKTNVISTDSYINKIIRLTVQTGLITAAAALLDMILYLTLDNTANFMFDFPLSKLYTNALISTLNARPWKEHVSQHEAPNALFEQSNMSGQTQTSFSLVQRRSVIQSHPRHSTHVPIGQEYYPRPPKFDVNQFDGPTP
ncbi:hypothetical protein B0H19DRAFT_1247539 [Mycena capillaripes]|nr:hypothetical protein B0H19DRAFT_1247539 [Mycena capillaripes]